MRRLIEYFVDHSLIVNAVMIAVCVVGIITFRGMSRDLIPAIQSPVVRIEGTLPGASATDCEQLLTFPIEEAVRDLAGIKDVRSKTTAGSFYVDVRFKSEHDELAESLETIRSRVDQVSNRFPRDLQPLKIRQRRQDRVDFVDVMITPVDPTNPQHRTWIRSFADRLDHLPHIVAVDSSLPDQDLYVEFDRPKIEAAGLSVSLVKQKVLDFLSYAPIGTVHSDYDRVSVELHKGFSGVASLERLPITRNRVGQGLDLADLATVELKASKQFTETRYRGQEFVQFELWKDTGSDIIRLEELVAEEIVAFNAKAPAPMKAEIIQSAGFLIEKPLRVILVNGVAGLFIVGVILFLFLGFRIASMAVIGLPFVYFGTFIVLDYLGIEIHLISVIGLILVLGILVDDAILVAERFQENLQNGRPPREAAIEAAVTLVRPVTGTILTNIVVFAPILFIKSEMSAIFYAIPCVIIGTLLLSLVESFFILPNHLRHFVPANYVFRERRAFLFMKGLYVSVLKVAVRFRYLAVLVFTLAFAFSVKLLIDIDKQFNLNLGTKNVYVRGVLKESASLDESLRRAAVLEAAVYELPEEDLDRVLLTVGEALAPGDHLVFGAREVKLKISVNAKVEDPQILADSVESRLNERFAKGIDGFDKIEVHQRKAGDEKEKNIVTIFVSGGDTLSFEEIQEEIRREVQDVSNVERVFMDPNRFQRSWQFRPDATQLAVYGVGHAELTDQLRQYFAPQELTRMRLDGDEITAYTRFAHPDDFVPGELSDFAVMTPRGIPVELSRLGKWHEAEVLKEITHLDLLREFEIDVLYDLERVTHDEIKEAIEAKLTPLRERYPQYTISVRPPERETEAKAWATKVALICLAVIFLTLIAVLGSVTQPLTVMFAIPFGISGVVFALVTHGMPLGLMAIIGLIGLTGVVVNDSLVMVDTINGERKDHPDDDYRDCVLRGAASRFKAVILTSLTTLGGVFPLAYGIGGKAGFAQPMVFALGWGLLFATLLTLVLLPCTLTMIDDVTRLFGRLLRFGRSDKRPTA